MMLLPVINDCPYCLDRQAVVLVAWHEKSTPTYQVRCDWCDARGPIAGNGPAAIAYWNHNKIVEMENEDD